MPHPLAGVPATRGAVVVQALFLGGRLDGHGPEGHGKAVFALELGALDRDLVLGAREDVGGPSPALIGRVGVRLPGGAGNKVEEEAGHHRTSSPRALSSRFTARKRSVSTSLMPQPAAARMRHSRS